MFVGTVFTSTKRELWTGSVDILISGWSSCIRGRKKIIKKSVDKKSGILQVKDYSDNQYSDAFECICNLMDELSKSTHAVTESAS